MSIRPQKAFFKTSIFSRLATQSLTVVLFIGLAVPTLSAQIPGPAPMGPFPRIANVWWGGYLDGSNPIAASQVQLYLAPQFSTAQFNSLRPAIPNTPMLVQVNIMETLGGVPAVPSNYYLLDTNGNQICNWPGTSPNFILNMTDPAVAQFVGQYAAQVLSQAGAGYNGVFFDNLITSIANKTTDCYGKPIQISSQGNGVADNPAMLNSAWAKGLYTALSTFKALAPGAYAVVHANGLPPEIRALGLVNGDSFGFDIPNIREKKLAFGELWDAYHTWFQRGVKPVLAAVQSSPPNQIAYGYGYTPGSVALPQTVAFGQTFYPNMRFGLALAMMDDGFFIHDFGDNSSPTAWWYDEYNFNLGLPAAPYQQIGSPAGVNQILNGSFEQGSTGWSFSVSNDGIAAATETIDNSTAELGSNSAHINVTSPGSAPYQVTLEQDNLALSSGAEYQVDFWAKSDVYFPLRLVVQAGKPTYSNYGLTKTITIAPGWNHYTVSFLANATASDGRLEFQFASLAGNVWVDNVQFTQAPTRLYRRDFQNGVVLLNGTNSPQTLNLEPGLSRFSGSQAPRYQYIVDDSDSAFTATGTWVTHTFDTGWRKAAGPYYHAWNMTLHELDTAGGAAQWNLGIPADGQYTIQVWLPAAPTANTWTNQAVYQITQGGSVVATVPIDQTVAAQGDQWVNLGTFTLNAAQNPILQLTNGGSAPLIADAVYVFSAVDRYNDGAPVSQVIIPPMDGILLQRQTPNQSITFPNPGPQVAGVDLALNSSATSGDPLSYTSNSAGVCQINGAVASFLTAGTCSITAWQTGGSGYTAAVPVTQIFPVYLPQTISMLLPPDQVLGAAPVSVNATASSGLPVLLKSSSTDICTVAGNAVSLVAAGTCVVVASQSGNSLYAAAPSTTGSFAIQNPQSISFGPLHLAAIGGLPATLTASASSGLPVLFTSNSPGVCIVTGSAVTLVAPGACSIMASQAGSALYAAAAPVTQSFTVVPNLVSNGGFENTASPWQLMVNSSMTGKASMKIDTSQFIDGKSSIHVNTMQAAASSWYVDLEQSPISIAAGATYFVQFWAKGDVSSSVQVAVQGGAPNYAIYGLNQSLKISTSWAQYTVSFTSQTSASDARLQFRFGQSVGNIWLDDVQFYGSSAMPQNLSFPPIANLTYAGSAADLNAVASSGLPISYSSVTPLVCSVSGAQVIPVAAGTCSVKATQAGNAVYQPASPITNSVAVNPASQSIAFGPLANTTYSTTPIPLGASSTSNLPVTFSSNSTSVCNVSGPTITILAAGACSITASQPGNANYSPAQPVTQNFTVAALTQALTFPPIAGQGLGGLPLTLAASSSSGLPVRFSSSTGAVCTVSGTSLTLSSPGTCSITASQPGNGGYSAAPTVTQSFSVSPNLIANSSFDSGAFTPWVFNVVADGYVSSVAALDTTTYISSPASALVTVKAAATASWHVDLENAKIPVLAGQKYVVQFWAKSSTARPLQIVCQGGSPRFSNYGLNTTVALITGWKQYTITFVSNATASDGRLEFYFGTNTGSVWLDNVQIYAAN